MKKYLSCSQQNNLSHYSAEKKVSLSKEIIILWRYFEQCTCKQYTLLHTEDDEHGRILITSGLPMKFEKCVFCVFAVRALIVYSIEVFSLRCICSHVFHVSNYKINVVCRRRRCLHCLRLRLCQPEMNEITCWQRQFPRQKKRKAATIFSISIKCANIVLSAKQYAKIQNNVFSVLFSFSSIQETALKRDNWRLFWMQFCRFQQIFAFRTCCRQTLNSTRKHKMFFAIARKIVYLLHASIWFTVVTVDAHFGWENVWPKTKLKTMRHLSAVIYSSFDLLAHTQADIHMV